MQAGVKGKPNATTHSKWLIWLFGHQNLFIFLFVYIMSCFGLLFTLRAQLIHDKLQTVTSSGHLTGKRIAIGSAITAKRIRQVNETNIDTKFVFLTLLVPSFCSTASPEFNYTFYVAYDFNDPVFSNHNLSVAFVEAFRQQIVKLCPLISATLQLVRCGYSGKPAWAQNDAMMYAYLDDMDYFYRINDDTQMITPKWTEAFVNALERYNPPRVGVVGPNHAGGKISILTYDFVHKTHIDVFGFYYPRLFTSWFGDGWITRVYNPGRCTKLSRVLLKHTLRFGQRYKVDKRVASLKSLEPRVREDRTVLNRYIEGSTLINKVSGKTDRIIAMSLNGSYPNEIWGVIRCAQLLPIHLPTWKLRVYVSDSPKLLVPAHIIAKLRELGAEIVYVPINLTKRLSSRYWRILVIEDPDIRYFLQRNTDWRLSDREAVSVSEWIGVATESKGIVHCIRDHPDHSKYPLVAGLWGGQPRPLLQRLNVTSLVQLLAAKSKLLKQKRDDPEQVMLVSTVWPAVSSMAYCHDNVSPCGKWTPRYQLAARRLNQEFIGQSFSQHHEPIGAVQVFKDVLCKNTSFVVIP